MSLAVDGVGVELDGRTILDDVGFSVPAGGTAAVLGPSGSGKSTLLRVVAGLQRPNRGRVAIGGTDVTATPPHRRGVGLLFQDDALFPHRDVHDNVAFGLRMRHAPRAEIEARVSELLAVVGLEGYGRRPVTELSGGERKRVALARALAPAPSVLLLDEPLGELDRVLRERLLEELRAIFTGVGVTAVVVTHDVGEAFALADEVVLLRDGRVVQTATPEALWAAPASAWVARFLGIDNVEQLADGRARVIRPEAVVLTPATPTTPGDATVTAAVRAGGPLVRLAVACDDGRSYRAVSTGLDHPGPGDRVAVTFDPLGIVELPG
ncbi:MAG: ABC transporter ATP-binding protein [Actinobacteria bacterium]|nr:ABC transporter ATP-binding protein [Actinomycetota bacterium]